MDLNIAVVGLGYVGLANAILLAQKNHVTGIDIDLDKIQLLKDGISPIKDLEVSDYLKNKSKNLKFSSDFQEGIEDKNYIIFAIPTDFDETSNSFNTENLEQLIIKSKRINKNATIIIKSTIPIGFTKSLQEKCNSRDIFFSPEFLREGKALHDMLFPSRIIIGSTSKKAKVFAQLLSESALSESIPTFFTGESEAEAIKLFSNTYLAMRVAFFNELDNYALIKDLSTKEIIKGICSDPRIGHYYNNPSFGYGGYCLPKDTKQLLSNFKDVPQNLISAIVESNITRKKLICDMITKLKPLTIGIHRLVMKSNSDNFRESAINNIIDALNINGAKILIYEPLMKEKYFMDCELIENLEDFKKKSDLIIANRKSSDLNDINHKLFSRDIFGLD